MKRKRWQCGASEKVYNDCSKCGEKNCLTSCGPGVERLEEEVLTKFPDSKTSIISSDTLKDSKSFNQFLLDVETQKVNIIIGTQIISKGHNLKNLTLVGIIDADLSLSGGDLRASEKTFQLLQQVSGRAGRETLRFVVASPRSVLRTVMTSSFGSRAWKSRECSEATCRASASPLSGPTFSSFSRHQSYKRH